MMKNKDAPIQFNHYKNSMTQKAAYIFDGGQKKTFK